MVRFLSVIFVGFALPVIAHAHAFGQSFNLPLPVNFYITGGLAAFIASCAVLLLFSNPTKVKETKAISLRIPAVNVLNVTLAILGVFLIAVSFILSVEGHYDYLRNPLPNLFWIIFLLFFTYCVAFVDGLWERINPFKTFARIMASKIPNRESPWWLGYFPVVFFFALLWLELFSYGLGAQPMIIGYLLVGYVSLSIVASYLLGINTWFKHGDFFSVFFGLIGKIAPIQLKENRIVFSLPGSRLIKDEAPHFGILLFILFLLGSTVLDGLRETQIWRDFLRYLLSVGIPVDNYIGIILLVLIPAILFGIYLAAMYGMKVLTKSDLPIRFLLLRFAYSLLPIAIVYHFAHYFSLVLSEGQMFIIQISDPLTKGWNILGTADYQFNAGLIGGDTVWYIQLGVIVAGHILAAIIAHRISQNLFFTRKQVMLSQLPMLVVMVFYTAFGLWTLSQPFAIGA